MEQFDIKLDGIEETVAMLEQAPKIIVARGFLKALQAGGNILADAIRAKAPIQEEYTGGILRQGELRASVRLRVTLDSGFRGGVAEINFGKAGPVAYWLEFGHRAVMHGATWADRKNNYKGKLLVLRANPEAFEWMVPAYPFVRSAVEPSWEPAVDAVVTSLKQTIESEYPQSSQAA